jgi:Family of unknown function (DUF6988)
MKQSPQISEILRKARELSGWLSERMGDGLQFPYEHRSGLAAACFDLVLEHHDAVILLFERQMPGSALSLVRSSYEIYIRGIWLLHCAIDSQIEQFMVDRFDPNVEKMISDLEKIPAYKERGILSESWKGKKFLHDFTHGGIRHLGRRIDASRGIGANYPDTDVITAVGQVSALALLSMVELAGICKNEGLQLAVLEKSKEYAE